MAIKKIPIEFFQRETTSVAKELIGKIFVRIIDGSILSAEIVETEAYLPHDDPACHAANKKTKRNAPMFEKGGILYVYFIYGNHFCTNIVTETEGSGSAVLIRAARPINGIKLMQLNRNRTKIEDLCSGPGKFAQAFGLNRHHNYHSLSSEDIFIGEFNSYTNAQIITTSRIGIKEGTDLPLRFYLENSRFVSKI